MARRGGRRNCNTCPVPVIAEVIEAIEAVEAVEAVKRVMGRGSVDAEGGAGSRRHRRSTHCMPGRAMPGTYAFAADGMSREQRLTALRKANEEAQRLAAQGRTPVRTAQGQWIS
jgi:hypothetical protein